MRDMRVANCGIILLVIVANTSTSVGRGMKRFGLLQDRDVAATERSPRVEERKGYRDSRVQNEATPSRRKTKKKTVLSFDGLRVMSLRLPSPRLTVAGDDTAKKGRRSVTVTGKEHVSFPHKDYP